MELEDALARPVIATWILLDSPDDAGFFPQAGRALSSSETVHSLYLRCVIMFFAFCSRTVSASYRLVLFTANAELPTAVLNLIRDFQVDIEVVPFRHNPPASYCTSWRNQFYILDIIKHLACHPMGTSYLILDSDCLITKSPDPLFSQLSQEGALLYTVFYSTDMEINGLTREGTKVLYEELLGRSIPSIPEYHGGELFAITSKELLRLDSLIDETWTLSLDRGKRGLPRFTEEAHFLSYLYFRLGYRDHSANAHIKRMWTLNLTFRNIVKDDYNLTIWHVLAEKRYGFSDLWPLVTNKKSWFWTLPPEEAWRTKIGKMMGVPSITPTKFVRNYWRAAHFRVERLLRSAIPQVER